MLAYLAYLCSIPRLGTAIAASSSAYAGPSSAHDVAAQDEHRDSVDEIMMNLRKIADLASSPSPAKDRKYSAMNYYGFNATPVQHSEASTLALSDQEASPVTLLREQQQDQQDQLHRPRIRRVNRTLASPEKMQRSKKSRSLAARANHPV